MSKQRNRGPDHGFRQGAGIAAAAHRAESRHSRPLQDLLQEAYPSLTFAQASLGALPGFLENGGITMALQPGMPIFSLPTVQPATSRPCTDAEEECECEEGDGVCHGCYEFHWSGAPYVAAFIPVQAGYCETTRMFLGAPSLAQVQALADALQQWADTPRQEVLVFHRGYWRTSRRLSRSVRAYTWEDVILPREQKEDVIRTVGGFFAHRESYRQLGLAYKRGILFLGPPGCGKTLTLRIVAGRMELPFLYIRSFDRDSIEDNIDEIFRTALRKAPCIVCWEDIDSLIPPAQMAFFLNALDGLENLDGLLTLASSNHPERIDRALLQRPSRFDRVFWFGLPDAGIRAEYLQTRLHRLEHIGVREEWPVRAQWLAARTEGYSYAYLQELFAQIGFGVLHEGSPFEDAAEAALGRLAEAMAIARALDDPQGVDPSEAGSRVPAPNS